MKKMSSNPSSTLDFICTSMVNVRRSSRKSRLRLALQLTVVVCLINVLAWIPDFVAFENSATLPPLNEKTDILYRNDTVVVKPTANDYQEVFTLQQREDVANPFASWTKASLRLAHNKNFETARDKETTERRTANMPPTHFPFKKESVCDGYQGILFISSVAESTRTGTFFFQAILDGIAFAEQYNLYPFVWIDGGRNEHSVWDAKVDGRELYGTFQHLSGTIELTHRHVNNGKCKGDPLRPDFTRLTYATIELRGNGMWQSYFEPMPMPFLDPTCQDKPLFFMKQMHLRGMHFCSEVSIKDRVSKKMVPDVTPKGQQMTLDDWMYDQRQRGARLVKKYYHPQQELLDKMKANNPAADGSSCLGVHVSRSSIEKYVPYINAYIQNVPTEHDNIVLFLATHDPDVLDELLNALPHLNPSMIKTQQPRVLMRSTSEDIFDAHEDEKHRLNVEVLTHMYLLSKCDFFLHGNFVAAEAVMYINPALHNSSINIDLPDYQRKTPEEFAELVRKKSKARNMST